MSPETPAPTSSLTAKEFYQSANGAERRAVRRIFDRSMALIGKEDPETWLEALVLLDLRRREVPDAERVAHSMTNGELGNYFTKEPEPVEGDTGPAPVPEPCSALTSNEFYDSVTGEERGLVARVYKRTLPLMGKDDPELQTEALVFLDLHRRREPDAQGRAYAMTNGELRTYFATATANAAREDDAGEA